MKDKFSSEKYFEELFNYSIISGESYTIGKRYAIDIKHGLVICGMGGSTIAGDIIQALASNTSPVPVVIHKGYVPPKFINKHWDVIIISYSGNTEETLSSFHHILSKTKRISVITSGGKLSDFSTKYSVPFILIKPGLQPRFAFYRIFGILLGMLHSNFEINCTGFPENLKAHCQLLQTSKYRESLHQKGRKLVDKYIVILSSNNLSGVASRFRCQLNENSKQHAFSFSIPEFSHNAIVGYENQLSKEIVTIILQSSFDYSRISLHLKFIESSIPNILIFKSTMGSLLLEILSLIAELDYLSIYLGQIQGADPSSIEIIDSLKNVLATSFPSYSKIYSN